MNITNAFNVRENIKEKSYLDLIGKFVSVGNMTLYSICEGCLQIYQVIIVYRIFSGSFLENLEGRFIIKLWWQKKKFFLRMHNTILQRVK